MGQYYKVVNITKKEFISPWTFDDGAKLVEFGASGEGTMFALAALLSDGNGRGGGDIMSDNNNDNSLIGSWAGDKIVISGDYADDNFLTREEKRALKKSVGKDNVNLYHAVHLQELGFIDISDKIIENIKRAGEKIGERISE